MAPGTGRSSGSGRTPRRARTHARRCIRTRPATAHRRAGRISSLRSSSASSSRTSLRGHGHPSSATAPGQNTLPDHRSVLHQRLALGGERVETGRDQRLDVSGTGMSGPAAAPGAPATDQGPGRSAGATNSSAYSGLPPARSSSSAWTPAAGPTGRAGRRSAGGLLSLTPAADRAGRAAAAPAGRARSRSSGRAVATTSRRQPRPSRSARCSRNSSIAWVGPMQVLDHQDQGSLGGHRLEEPPPRGEDSPRLAAPRRRSRARPGGQPRPSHRAPRSRRTRRRRGVQLGGPLAAGRRTPGCPPGP